MTDKELLYIKTIAEAKSITKAVAILGVNQSSLSRCIKKIETEYSIKLFHKSKNLLLPTIAGESYLNSAEKILNRYEQLKNELSNSENALAGTLNIGTGIHQAHAFLPYLLPELKTLYPNVKINLTETQTIPLNQLLETGDIDIMIAHLPLLNQNFEFLPLFNESFRLVAPMGEIKKSQIHYKKGQATAYIALETLKEKPFILGYQHQYSRIICDNIFHKAGFVPSIVQLTRNMENARRLCATGLGYAILPKSSADISHPQFETESFHLDEDLKPYWTMAAIYKTVDTLSPIAKVFLKLLSENARIMQAELPTR